METKYRLVVHSKNSIYDDLICTVRYATQYLQTEMAIDNNSHNKELRENPKKELLYVPAHLNNQRINSYAVSAYINTLKRSCVYRNCAVKPLLRYNLLNVSKEECPVIFIKLREPKKQFLDYKWGERITQMALERREVDHAMSWLSTLGGAFSALGEHFQHCAQMAGKISIHQFKLAFRLEDPLLVARCKLYAALSMIQQGNLRIPRLMIQEIFKYGLEQKDIHLQRMCQGVWAKLRYCYKLRRQKRNHLKN